MPQKFVRPATSRGLAWPGSRAKSHDYRLHGLRAVQLRGTVYRHLLHRFGFKKGAHSSLFVGICSVRDGHLYFEGIGGTNIGPDTTYSWLSFLEM